MDTLGISTWNLPTYRSTDRLLIAGPCSAETPEQVMESCSGAAANGAHILRAGIWKPRTRPDSFEGVGKAGLPWLKEAGTQTGLPVTTEVANPHHVESALKADIDVLWIGARSTANPFTVQHIADALKGVDIPILIKNPINPDLDLWIGAIERIYRAGIRKIALIHRGYSVFKPGRYRNAPMWQLPIEVRRRLPELDIICDPSHIAGKRALLHEIAQRAIDLDFDGLMIETHVEPKKAWSDAAQQVTATGLKALLDNLIMRYPSSDNPDFLSNLEALRYDIDQLDKDIIELLAKRMEVSREIGKYKKASQVSILQLERWTETFADRVNHAVSLGLSETFARNYIQYTHEESIWQQNQVMNEEETDREA